MSRAMVKMGNNVWFFPGCGMVAAPAAKMKFAGMFASETRGSELRAILKYSRLSPLILARLNMQRLNRSL